MNYCTYPLLRHCDTPSPTLEECGEPASVKMPSGDWLCLRHAQMVIAEARRGDLIDQI